MLTYTAFAENLTPLDASSTRRVGALLIPLLGILNSDDGWKHQPGMELCLPGRLLARRPLNLTSGYWLETIRSESWCYMESSRSRSTDQCRPVWHHRSDT